MLEELWSHYKFEKDSYAREELLTKCLPLVKSLAQKYSVYASPCCDADDLVSAGIIGLMDALEKFDPIEQTSFRTYAKCRIRGAMLDEIRNLKWAPRSIQEKTRSLRNAHTHLEQKLSRAPLEEELAEDMEMSIEQFRKMMLQIGPSAIFLSSTRSIEDEEETYLEAHFEDAEALSPVDQVISNETKSILSDAIRSLPEKESVVISLYYYDEMTMKEIGRVLSLTESRVCQIHSKAILRLFQVLDTKMTLDESKAYEQVFVN
ncbi:MAG: polymerase sigma factor [Candidatus Poribacteria bacterium]|nr:polymerase sigma factor [Candidatus Poribacteria bacterium]